MNPELGLAIHLGVSALVGFWVWSRLRPTGRDKLWFWVLFLVGYFSSFPLMVIKAGLIPWIRTLTNFSPEVLIFLGGAVIEEAVKAALLILLLKRFSGLQVWEAAAWGVLISLGFGTAENLLFQFRSGELLWVRFFTALPLHLACGAILGAGIAQSRTIGALALVVAVLESMAWHGLYNFSVSSGAVPLWFILGLMVLLVLRVSGLFKREKISQSSPTESP